MRTLALLLVLTAPALAGENAIDEIHSRLAEAMPETIRVKIEIGEGPFRIGDAIPFVLVVENDTGALLTGSRSTDRRGRPVLLPTLYAEGPDQDDFVPEPDPLAWMAPREQLETVVKGIREELDLADSLRIGEPGRWRFLFTGGVIVLGHQVPLVSPIVEIEVRAAEEEQAVAVERAIADLAADDPETRAKAAARLDRAGTRDALRALIPFLESPELGPRAWHAFLRPLDPAGALADLEALLSAPGVPVGRTYLRMIASLLEPPKDPRSRATGTVDPDLRRRLLLRLDAVLPEKVPEALPPAIRALAGAFTEVESPAHLPPAVARAWAFLTEDERQVLLTGPFWPRVRSAAMAPPLAAAARAEGPPAPWHADDPRSLAAQRLLELRPDEARPLLLEDMARPEPLLSSVALLALPDESLPELTETWSRNLRDREFGDLAKLAPLVTRYGTKDLVPVVKEVYGTSDAWATEIQAAFLRFLLKQEPEPALDLVRRAVLLRERTGSYRTVLSDVLPFRWSAEAEALALSFLGDEDRAVAADAARVLLRHGSAATTAPLTDALGVLDADRDGRLRLEILLALLGRTRTGTETRALEGKLASAYERELFERADK